MPLSEKMVICLKQKFEKAENEKHESMFPFVMFFKVTAQPSDSNITI